LVLEEPAEILGYKDQIAFFQQLLPLVVGAALIMPTVLVEVLVLVHRLQMAQLTREGLGQLVKDSTAVILLVLPRSRPEVGVVRD
jgi:hypothetical protein